MGPLAITIAIVALAASALTACTSEHSSATSVPRDVADCGDRGKALALNFDRVGITSRTNSPNIKLPGADAGGLLCEYVSDHDGTSIEIYFQDDGTVHEAKDGTVGGLYKP